MNNVASGVFACFRQNSPNKQRTVLGHLGESCTWLEEWGTHYLSHKELHWHNLRVAFGALTVAGPSSCTWVDWHRPQDFNTNLVHVLLKNFCHESVGVQRAAASKDGDGSMYYSFSQVALAARYSRVYSVCVRLPPNRCILGNSLFDRRNEGNRVISVVQKV